MKKKFKAEIVSFLNNNSRGVIYLGVDDDGNEVVFESEEKKREKYKVWEEKLSNWVKDAFSSDVVGLVEILNNQSPFEIRIYPGSEKPYYFKNGEGFNGKGIYIRVGSTKRRASDDEIKRMMFQSSKVPYDAQDSGHDSLTFSTYKRALQDSGRDFDPVSLRIKLKSENSRYNNAGLLLSDQNHIKSKFAVFEGITARKFKDKRLLSESIINQIDDAMSLVRLYNLVKTDISGSPARSETLSYPEEAVREEVVNAFAHRDYSLSADIKIEIFDDRLEIFSPGSIPAGFSVEKIKEGSNARRNDNLVNALDKVNYMENYGSGIRRIYSLYNGFNKQPLIKSTENSFKIILYNKNYYLNKLPEESMELQIIEFLKDGKEVSRSDIENLLDIRKSRAIELLNILKENESIIVTGQSRSTRYSLKG